MSPVYFEQETDAANQTKVNIESQINMHASLIDFIRRRPVLSFYLLAFSFSWAFLLLAYGVLKDSLSLAWIGMFGPAIAALLVTGIVDGKTGLEQLLARLLRWRVRLPAYAFVFSLPVVLVIGTILFRDGPAELGNALTLLAPRLPFVLGMTLLMAPVIAGEEVGWRGFALPRLQERFGPVKASLLVGLLWGIWHVPAALDPTNVLNRVPPFTLSVALFILGTIGFSFLYTGLWNYSSGSLLLVCLFHAFYNNLNLLSAAVYPYVIDQFWLYLAVLAVVLIIFWLAGMRSRHRMPVLKT